MDNWYQIQDLIWAHLDLELYIEAERATADPVHLNLSRPVRDQIQRQLPEQVDTGSDPLYNRCITNTKGTADVLFNGNKDPGSGLGSDKI